LVFDGVDDYVNVGTYDKYFPTGAQSHNLCVSFWVQILGSLGTNEIVVGSIFDDNRLYLGKNSGNWRFGWGGTTWNSSFSGSLVSVTSNWTNYTFNVINGTATLFINSIQSISQTDTTVTLQNVLPIGGYFRNGLFSSSTSGANRIAQVSIYNRALTASEIQQNFNALRSRYGI
jgi:hypothetical protein